MKLSEILKINSSQTNTSKETQDAKAADGASAERINRQIKALTPGRTLQGEVLEKNGNEVKIRLSNELVVTARLEQDVNVEAGKLLTFEVKNNGSTLALSPLFANTAATDNVYKALQMANLPINSTTVEMTEAMMQQGMSVDSRSLQAMFKDVSAFPGTAAINIVQLNQLKIPVNDANIGQLENYKELVHQLLKGMTDVIKELPIAFQEMYITAGSDKAVQMYQALLSSFLEELPQGEAPLTDGGVHGDMAGSAQEDALLNAGNGSINGEGVSGKTGAEAVQNSASLPEGMERLYITEALTRPERENLAKLLSQIPEDACPQKETLIQQVLQGTADTQNVVKLLAGLHSDRDIVLNVALADIFRSAEYHKMLESVVMKQWSLAPEQLTQEKKVEEVYSRLLRQLGSIKETLQESGAQQTGAMKSVTNLSSNIDFMSQLNNLYTYVQLPLKLNDRQANGELYVYTNKRSLAQKDGAVSAFLHLDMENLGAVDVYIAMQNERVNTRFTLQDDAMLDFLNKHMHILNERLEKKGYAMQCEMTVKEPEEKELNPIERILQADKNAVVVAQHGFDVRT